jgi:hypothetical protein
MTHSQAGIVEDQTFVIGQEVAPSAVSPLLPVSYRLYHIEVGLDAQ